MGEEWVIVNAVERLEWTRQRVKVVRVVGQYLNLGLFTEHSRTATPAIIKVTVST
jgi:hypothetical protein